MVGCSKRDRGQLEGRSQIASVGILAVWTPAIHSTVFNGLLLNSEFDSLPLPS